jgi:ABC-2 type transport system ATP-binding protein
MEAPAISTEGLTKRFGPVVALDGLTLEVPTGTVFGFLGPNGAGKTTTVRLLLGLIRASSGSARVLDADPWDGAPHLHRRVAYVPGELAVWPQLRGGETLELLGRLHGGFDAAYRDELVERFEFDPSKRGRTYSKGNRQKIGLIAALMTRAELLVLDEPTAGLDPLMEIVFRDCVREAVGRGQTVFLSSHMLSEVESVCTRVGILRQARLVESGRLEDLRGLAARSVTVRFRAAVPDGLDRIAGVESVTVAGTTAHLQVHGSADALVKELARHEVESLDSREPSLEELFLTYYGTEVAHEREHAAEAEARST